MIELSNLSTAATMFHPSRTDGALTVILAWNLVRSPNSNGERITRMARFCSLLVPPAVLPHLHEPRPAGEGVRDHDVDAPVAAPAPEVEAQVLAARLQRVRGEAAGRGLLEPDQGRQVASAHPLRRPTA